MFMSGARPSKNHTKGPSRAAFSKFGADLWQDKGAGKAR
ncbi:hypothetical protein RKLH11_1261 [Rhodobacteraceae bacterium KLH11]|nr:hypothetical protein RKLH11_1261 [Rhodobacteraceae bacterium KLH11]